MNCKIFYLSICLLAFLNGSYASKNDTLKSSSLYPYGRYFEDKQLGLELISSAVHFGFRFSGTACKVFAFIKDHNGHNYLQYTLDGIYQKRIKINGSSDQPFLLSGLKEGMHTVWIYKATEAQTGPVYIQMITGHQIVAIHNPNLPLIEFIGNSITCGAASDPSEVPCNTGEYHDQHNAYYAYGPRVSRLLNVNFLMSSVSGVGIYRNWDVDGPAMPLLYENTDLQFNSHRPWPFKTYSPKIVSIALGTNDLSMGDHIHPRLPFDSATYVNTFISFVKLIKKKYPSAQIALLSSPMINGEKREILQHCLTEVKKGVDAQYPKGKRVALFFFQPMQAHGCGGHPNLEDHAILASEL